MMVNNGTRIAPVNIASSSSKYSALIECKVLQYYRQVISQQCINVGYTSTIGLGKAQQCIEIRNCLAM